MYKTPNKVCMYVCMYVCMHACMHTSCMHACMHACMYVCMYVCTFIGGFTKRKCNTQSRLSLEIYSSMLDTGKLFNIKKEKNSEYVYNMQSEMTITIPQ